jgi:hypothetical protein
MSSLFFGLEGIISFRKNRQSNSQNSVTLISENSAGKGGAGYAPAPVVGLTESLMVFWFGMFPVLSV